MPVTFEPGREFDSLGHFPGAWAETHLIGKVYETVDEALNTVIERAGPHGHWGDQSLNDYFCQDRGRVMGPQKHTGKPVEALRVVPMGESREDLYRTVVKRRGPQTTLRV